MKVSTNLVFLSFAEHTNLLLILLSHCLCKRGIELPQIHNSSNMMKHCLPAFLLKYYNQSRNCLTLVVAQSRNLPLVINDRAGRSIHTVNFTISQSGRTSSWLRWPEPIYLLVGYVFESGFLAGMIWLISMIFGILNKEWSNIKKMLFIFLRV